MVKVTELNFCVKNRKLSPPEEWVKVENAYQGIITQAEVEEVFRRSQVNKGRKLSRKGKYLMTGLLKYPECSYRFVSHGDLKWNQIKPYLRTKELLSWRMIINFQLNKSNPF